MEEHKGVHNKFRFINDKASPGMVFPRGRHAWHQSLSHRNLLLQHPHRHMGKLTSFKTFHDSREARTCSNNPTRVGTSFTPPHISYSKVEKWHGRHVTKSLPLQQAQNFNYHSPHPYTFFSPSLHTNTESAHSRAPTQLYKKCRCDFRSSRVAITMTLWMLITPQETNNNDNDAHTSNPSVSTPFSNLQQTERSSW